MAADTLTRRELLNLSLAVGGGLVLGRLLPALAAVDTPDLQPNPFVRVGTDGTVTVWVNKSEMGQGVLTGLAQIIADELGADWEKVVPVQADADPRFGNQNTGGSTAVRTQFQDLRRAGAAAREMLLAAAAARWQVPAGRLRAEGGRVWDGSGRSLSFGELVAEAARLPVPQDPPLKKPADFSLIGRPLPRKDTRLKVTGKAVFGADVRLPGMLFAVVARPPVFGARLARLDTSRAEKVEGVVRVFPISSGVAVVARDTWAALKGREALVVMWEEGEASSFSSLRLQAEMERLAEGQGKVAAAHGSAEALSPGARQVEATFSLPFLAHAPMEPQNATAWFHDGGLEVWAPTQVPMPARQEAAQAAGLPLEKVTLHVTFLGGGFGRRLVSDFVREAVEVAKAFSVPVQLLWTREDDLAHDFYRPPSVHRLQAWLDGQGQVLRWRHHQVTASIGQQRNPSRAGRVDRGALEGAEPPYAFSAWQVEQTLVSVPVPLGAWRSVYASQNPFASEHFFDLVARAAGRDPWRWRLELLPQGPLKAAVRLAGEKASWSKPLPKGWGRGVACCSSFGSHVAEVAEVSLRGGRLRVERVVVAIHCGMAINPRLVEQQLVSAVVFGLSAFLRGRITVEGGKVLETNFDRYDILRFSEMPRVEVHIVPSQDPPGGVGEPGVPPLAPAVANAVLAATGKPVARLPWTEASGSA